jgi:large subunit ribosomal protein L35
MLKTNKSLSKRIKVTKTGKVLKRKQGKGHFNAKMKRSKQLAGKRMQVADIKKSEISKLMPYN